MPPLLEVRDAGKSFWLHQAGKQVVACRGVSLTAAAGELTALVGKSGSGKSSLIKCVYRTYKPTAGSFVYRTAAGERIDLAAASDAQVLELRRTEIRYAQQHLPIVPRQSAVTTVARQLRQLGYTEAASADRARAQLDRVGLPERLWDLHPRGFSGGERQLVNLASALVVPPRLLLLDEPVASLDPVSKLRVLELIDAVKASGVAMVGVFHEGDVVARLADHVVEFTPGAREALADTGPQAGKL